MLSCLKGRHESEYHVNKVNIICRYFAWMKKTKGSIKSAPQLTSLPPTKEAFKLNVNRGHLQCAVSKYAMCHEPPAVDEADYGYERNQDEKTLDPITLPMEVNFIPPEVQKILCCNCKVNEPCGKGNCTYCLGSIGCTIFCGCYSQGTCKNPYTVKSEDGNNPEDETVLAETDE